MDNQEQTTKELLPCPFCGSAAELCDDEIIQCSNNLCQVSQYTREKWNTRTEYKLIENPLCSSKDGDVVLAVPAKIESLQQQLIDLRHGRCDLENLLQERDKQLVASQQALDRAVEALEELLGVLPFAEHRVKDSTIESIVKRCRSASKSHNRYRNIENDVERHLGR